MWSISPNKYSDISVTREHILNSETYNIENWYKKIQSFDISGPKSVSHLSRCLVSYYEALEIPETGSGTLAQYAHWTETKAVQDMKTFNDSLSILGVCGFGLFCSFGWTDRKVLVT